MSTKEAREALTTLRHFAQATTKYADQQRDIVSAALDELDLISGTHEAIVEQRNKAWDEADALRARVAELEHQVSVGQTAHGHTKAQLQATDAYFEAMADGDKGRFLRRRLWLSLGKVEAENAALRAENARFQRLHRAATRISDQLAEFGSVVSSEHAEEFEDALNALSASPPAPTCPDCGRTECTHGGCLGER